MIYFRTCAYNAEQTLERAIESVLNQGCKEFQYWILDNGSTDRTGEIVRKYAAEDSRIIPFYNKRNRDFSENKEFWNMTRELKDEDYFITLDADDYYEERFIEEVLAFMQKNQLDIAACGTRFFDAATGNTIGERVLSQNIILDRGESFAKGFGMVYWNLRQVWGKIYTGKAARARYEIDLPEWYPKAYGGDTINVFTCVKASGKVGVYAKVLHNYAVSNKSVSHKWIEGREKSDVILFEKAVELLETKCNEVSLENLHFLYLVYYNAILDTFTVLFNSELNADKKISIAKEILLHPVTQKMFWAEIEDIKKVKNEFYKQITKALLEVTKDVSNETSKELFQIFISKNEEVSKLIKQDELAWYLKFCPIVVYHIVFCEYLQALNRLIVCIIELKDWSNISHASLILGQNLAALSENSEKYMFFSKKLISWYIINNQIEEARKELEEWLQILPEDDDFKKLYHLCKIQ